MIWLLIKNILLHVSAACGFSKSTDRDGILKEDDRLGSEQDISREYNVSRITVRKAFEILADEGYVTKTSGNRNFRFSQVN